MTALPYDDGTDRIPGDLVGPVERVVVVGAGIAGLAVANALGHAGVPTVVLEARDRIGGRLHTLDLAGSPVDMGGSWIHTPIGNPLTALAEHLGVERRPADITDGLVGWDPRVGWLPPAECERISELAFRRFDEALPGLAEALGPTAPMDVAVDRFVADHWPDPAEPGARHLAALLRNVIEADASGALEDLAIDGYPANGLFYEGSEVGDAPLGGYARLLAPLAAGLDVRTGQPVVSIAVRADGVEVATMEGAVHAASHVVVTVPLGVLKAGAISFDPPLPDDRRAAIARLGFGGFEKVAAKFGRRSCPDAQVPGVAILPSHGEPSIAWLVNLDPLVGEPVVVALAYGSRTGVLRDVPLEAAFERVEGVIEAMAGRRLPPPEAAARSCWSADPYTRGAYTFLGAGSTPDDLEDLGRPICGRLLFAGEATGHARVGFADGAFSSGIREAKRLLGQPRVLLGPR